MPTLVSWRKNVPQPSERVLRTHILCPEQQVVSFLFHKMFRTPLLEEMDLKLIWTLPPSITIEPSPLHLPSWTKWIKFSLLMYCKHSNFDSGKVWEWGLSYHNSRFITLITVTGSRIWITIIAFFLTCAFTDVSSQSELLTELNIIEEPMGWVYAALGTFMYNSSNKTSCQTFHGRNESHYGEL